MAGASPPLNRSEKQRDRDVRALISRVSGLRDESDANFQLALRFAWSNLRFHHFLDVSSHKVERTIEGIYEKLVIHSDLSKAASWKRFTEAFLSAPLPSTKETKTDTHYVILSLLLGLSDSPSNNSYAERPREEEAEKEEEFDWEKYLLDGEEIGPGPEEDTPDWSDASEEEDEQQPLSREDSGIQVDRTPLEEPGHGKRPGSHATWKVGDPDSRSWLELHVTPPYWTTRPTRLSNSQHLHSNLAAVWARHLHSRDPFRVPEDRTYVTEIQAVRETLWLLSGVKKLFIFQCNDGKVTVRDDIVVSHLTQDCLRSVLEQIAAYGQVVHGLQQFMDEIMGRGEGGVSPSPLLPPKKTPPEPPFRTYQAFMWALFKYFTSFRRELTEMEHSVLDKEGPVTLATVVGGLGPRLAQLKVLHKVFRTGVAEVPPATRNVVRASHLLNTLYKAILEYDALGEASERTVSLLFSLWVETVRPYLQTVDEWIVHGNLFDPAKEFIIQRNKNVPVRHRDFWYATYTLYSVSERSEKEEKPGGGGGPDMEWTPPPPAIPQHTMVSFLKPVLKQIIMAGKSMQLLKNLRGPHASPRRAAARDAERKSLYALFVESVQSRLRHGEDAPGARRGAAERGLLRACSLARGHLRLDDLRDPLLAMNFARLYPEPSDFPAAFPAGEVLPDRSSESVTCRTFELTLRCCLYPHIERRYVACCGNLMGTLKKDYRLVEYLQAMRNFFLIEAGDTMYDFYTAIFEKIREKESWRNAALLNVQLQEAVGQRYPEDSARLSISFDTVDPAKKAVPIHNLDGLTLTYKVPWPVDIVISSECQKIYNQVFLLLLQIKLAKYNLDVLRFDELIGPGERPQPKGGPSLAENPAAAPSEPPGGPRKQQIHRMFLLRVKLMHFVNSLHNYIMTRILHSTGLEFQHQVEEAKDLDQLIKIHYRYLSTIHDRCLLREKVSFVKEAIMKVLNLVLMFADRWQAGFGAWKMESIEKMESDFKNCHMFLVTVLNKAVRRGSFPHLESLALSLVAGVEQS
ncbi:gamma-tubulin complex component 5 [Tachyglossus aculeatus]|uniref:gamma-tubulin complex component 5 n=1 Tax=Tachyglossus aculeatus TaxID=9261 RepID=UPI0018F68CE2|nr:gamma-tubulin complex component 5 [Tachyglossus aculeatus]